MLTLDTWIAQIRQHRTWAESEIVAEWRWAFGPTAQAPEWSADE
jgi:hypothetical protein